MKTENVATSAMLIMVCTALGYGAGLITQILTAMYFGTSAELDAFVVASIIPNLVYGMLTAVFFTLILILYKEYQKKKNNTDSFITTAAIALVAVITLVSSLVWALAPLLVTLLANDFSIQNKETTVELLRILTIATIFLGITTLTTALLHIKKRFTTPALLRLILGIGIIGAILFFAKNLGIHALAYGTLVGAAIAVLMQCIECYYAGIRLSFSSIDKDLLKKIGIMSIPLLLYNVFFYFNKSLNSIFAVSLEQGSVATLNYAFLLISFPVILISSSLAIALFPTMRELVVDKKSREFKELANKAIAMMIFLFVPITIFTIFLGKDIIMLLFERGLFDAQATQNVYVVLIAYAVGLIAYGIHAICIKMLYAIKKVYTQMYLMGALLIITAVLSILLMDTWGAIGLAGAYAVAHWIIVCVFIGLFMKWEYMNVKALMKSIEGTMYAAVALTIVMIAAAFVKNILQGTELSVFMQVIRLAVLLLLGSISYIFVAQKTKSNEYNILKRKVIGVIHEKVK